MKSGRYSSALKCAYRLLEEEETCISNSSYSFLTESYAKLWTLKLNLLLKIGLIDLVAKELEHFDNDWFIQLFSHDNTVSSFLPFSLRIIHAVIPSMQGKTHESLDRLNKLNKIIDQILSTSLSIQGTRVWRARKLNVLEMILHVTTSASYFELALQTCFLMLAHLGAFAEDEDSEFIQKQRRNLIGKLGKLYLLMGQTVLSQKSFEKYLQLFDANSASYQLESLLCKTYAAVAHANYGLAVQLLEEALQIDPTNVTVRHNFSSAFLQGADEP
ncbi:Trafficking protein particle complex subunit 12 [Cichlidogyrus casuarinus]|uniref:Trafficking protein particle complex subunit 12 n=1 Tax=Cichlidogyrus casuarinus TaxID=1844966 RepID=A0ABD2QDD2_9PLAT